MKQHEDLFTPQGLKNTLLKYVTHWQSLNFNSFITSCKQSRKGYINWKEFRRVLNKLSVTITDDQFTKLMAMIDPGKTGRISYHQFLNMFEERETEVFNVIPPWIFSDTVR